MAPLKDIIVPEFGMSTEEVEVASWLKRPGEQVLRGEVIVTLITDKAEVDLEASDTGVLAEVVADVGQTVAVGAVIGRLELDNADGTAISVGIDIPIPTKIGSIDAPIVATQSSHVRSNEVGGEGFRATPFARRIARDNGVDLSTIAGSGPSGRIRRVDIENVLSARAVVAGDSEGIDASRISAESSSGRKATRSPLSAAQQRLAKRLVMSAAIPQFSVARNIDISSALAAASESGAPSLSDVLVKAVAMTLRRHSALNAEVDGDELVILDQINIGVAVAVGADLFVPVIRNADTRSIFEISAERKELTSRARDGTLKRTDTLNGTFTISNMGPLGVTDVHAIVTPPQVAILGIGAPVSTVVPRGQGTEVRQISGFRITCDHRAVNGALAASFLADLNVRLSSPFAIGES
jgi:pyruvate dehydrogenase E2 component (dihydrolipoamide acetyltransferase)